MTELPPSIRKVAVLVMALDERSADSLLDSMPHETAKRVRASIMELGDVSPAEQEAVLAEFLRRQSSPPPAAGVELDAALANRFDDVPSDSVAAPPPAARPFDFLRHVPPRAISRVLSGEHEQTIALVVSRLDADLAAQVLEQLPPEQATGVLERLAWLDEPAAEVLVEIERHLRAELVAYVTASGGPSQALVSVKALVGAMDLATRERLLSGLGQRNSRLACELGFTPVASRSRQAAVESQPYEVSAFRYRLERPDPVPATIEFDDFTVLSDDALKQVLAAAGPRTALLALTGADETLIDRILEPLSPREAEILRQRLIQSAVVRPREIEAARQHLAAIARRLAAEGTIVLPAPRRFAAAA